MAGVLSHALNPLRVAGNRIVDCLTGRAVRLRGIVRSGLEYSVPDHRGSLASAGITAEDIGEIIAWGSNIVRLPFNQDWALARPGYDPSRYLDALDFVIEAAASRGAYTLLDLQWLDARTPRGTVGGKANFVAPLPDLSSAEVWRQLATRYAGESAVLYDIFNEPHDRIAGDPVPLFGLGEDLVTFRLRSRRVGMTEWQPWARYLIASIRGANPDALIFVSGTDWGYDLRGFPLQGVPGLVYSAHIYRNKGANWNEAFGALAATHPVFAAEWGGGPDDLEWGRTLVRYLDERDIGWTAWSWSDMPRLLLPPLILPLIGPDYRASAFGQIVRDSLKHASLLSD